MVPHGFSDQPGCLTRTNLVRRCVLVAIEGTNRGRVLAEARARGWPIERTLEVGRSGARAVLEELEHAAHRGVVDAVVVDTLLWPGVGVVATLRHLNVLAQLGVELISLDECWFNVTTQKQFLEWVIACLDNEHRARIRVSLDKVRSEGRPLGRPRAVIPTEQVLQLRAGGASLRAIARATKLGVSTIQRFLVAFDRVAAARKSGVR